MDYFFTGLDIKLVFPLITVAVFIILVIVSGYGFRREGSHDEAYISLFGVGLAAFFTVRLWNSGALAFGGLIIADNYSFAAMFILYAGFILHVIQTLGENKPPLYYLIMLVSLLGLMITATAGDLLSLFAGLEIASAAIMDALKTARGHDVSISGKSRLDDIFGSLATISIIAGIISIYTLTGTTNLYSIKQYLVLGFAKQHSAGAAVQFLDKINVPGVDFPISFFFAGFCLIAAGFSYKTAVLFRLILRKLEYSDVPSSILGYMNTMFRAAAFAALFRILYAALPTFSSSWKPSVIAVADILIITGIVTGVMRKDMRGLLVSMGRAHAGFVMLAVWAGEAEGNTAMFFCIAVYTVTNSGAFALSEIYDENKGFLISPIGKNVLTVLAVVIMISHAAVPATGGFIAAARIYSLLSGATGVFFAAASVITALIYIRVLMLTVRKRSEAGELESSIKAGSLISAAAAAIFAVVAGIQPEWLYGILWKAKLFFDNY